MVNYIFRFKSLARNCNDNHLPVHISPIAYFETPRIVQDVYYGMNENTRSHIHLERNK